MEHSDGFGQSLLPVVDTHCHLDMVLHKLGLENLESLWASTSYGVPEAIIHVACHPDSFAKGLEFAETEPRVWCAFGVHPHDARLYNDKIAQKLESLITHPRCVALGECGLDYHYEHSDRATQKRVFAHQLQLARKYEKPLVVHTREAEDDTLEILQNHLCPRDKIHVHCYTGNADFAKQLQSLPGEIYLGFTGIITFKNTSSICEVAAQISCQRLLLETDAPFLAPLPWRGKCAQPGMVLRTAQVLAQLRGCTLENLLATCRENTKNMYGI